MRILLVDAHPERAAVLEQTLLAAGHHIVAHLDHGCDLREQVLRVAADLVIIDIDTPTREIFEHLHALNREQPLPVVIFTQDDRPELMRTAVAAGVGAYVVGAHDPARVAPLLTLASSRFEHLQAIKRELKDARSALADRKVIEKAKGILMKQKSLEEGAAYGALRRMAMDRNLKLVELARSLIVAAELLV